MVSKHLEAWLREFLYGRGSQLTEPMLEDALNVAIQATTLSLIERHKLLVDDCGRLEISPIWHEEGE